jgi:hypothetical protein
MGVHVGHDSPTAEHDGHRLVLDTPSAQLHHQREATGM